MNALTLGLGALMVLVLAHSNPTPQPIMYPDYESEYLLDTLEGLWAPRCLEAHDEPRDGTLYTCYGV